MTKASAFRRTTAARLLARFPVVADYATWPMGDCTSRPWSSSVTCSTRPTSTRFSSVLPGEPKTK
jgi:hypothetical protein